MVASVGPTVGTVIRWVSRPVMPSAVARPSTAVSIGTPIAMKLPNVSARMSIAVSRPTTSLLSVGEGDSTANLVDVLLGILQAPATVRVGQDSSGN